jgi:hypothetical protein
VLSDDDITILAVSWTPEGLSIQYGTATDVRAQGHLMAQHVLNLHHEHPDYREDMGKLHDRAVRILQNALEDFEESPPGRPDDEDDDDERGMGE